MRKKYGIYVEINMTGYFGNEDDDSYDLERKIENLIYKLIEDGIICENADFEDYDVNVSAESIEDEHV